VDGQTFADIEAYGMERWVEDWPQVKQRVPDFLDQFAHGSSALLRYVGLVGKGKLATVINTS